MLRNSVLLFQMPFSRTLTETLTFEEWFETLHRGRLTSSKTAEEISFRLIFYLCKRNFFHFSKVLDKFGTEIKLLFSIIKYRIL